MKFLNIVIFFFVSLLFFQFSGLNIFAQTPTVTVTPEVSTTITPTTDPAQKNKEEINKLNDKIQDLQSKIGDLQNQENTLSSQIDVMDNQIQLTQYKINKVEGEIVETNKDINSAGTQITSLESSLSNVTKVLLNRIVATYQSGEMEPLRVLLASNNLRDFLNRESYLRIVQEHDKQLLYNTQQAKVDYANQKDILEDKKQQIIALQNQLEDYTQVLDSQKSAKQKLLAETQGNEANYQRLLSQARAQLEGFSKFTANQGGASLLSGQTECDDWGCYYNQRDSQWGGSSLNGTQYTLASDGCLVTSMAMVYTHYGHRSVTPQTINSISGNFASYYPAYLKKEIVADGTASSRVYASIDSVLSTGHPVVIGISYDGGGLADHFLVLISGSEGNYMMNDPFTPNGHNISFRGRYPTEKIVEIEKVVM